MQHQPQRPQPVYGETASPRHTYRPLLDDGHECTGTAMELIEHLLQDLTPQKQLVLKKDTIPGVQTWDHSKRRTGPRLPCGTGPWRSNTTRWNRSWASRASTRSFIHNPSPRKAWGPYDAGPDLRSHLADPPQARAGRRTNDGTVLDELVANNPLASCPKLKHLAKPLDPLAPAELRAVIASDGLYSAGPLLAFPAGNGARIG